MDNIPTIEIEIKPSFTAEQLKSATWRKANPEKVKEYTAYRKEKARIKSAEWRKANPERVKEQYKTGKESHRVRSAAWKKANPEKVAASRAASERKKPEKYAALAAAWSKENADKVEASRRLWKEANPEKNTAHTAVNAALRSGSLIKQPCEVCGVQKVHGHHDDYSRPLEVRWLCCKHHKEWHKNNKC